MSGWTIVWIVLLSLLGLLVLLLAVPIYLRVTFHGELTVLVRVWGIPFRLYPRKKKPEKEKPPRRKSPKRAASKNRESCGKNPCRFPRCSRRTAWGRWFPITPPWPGCCRPRRDGSCGPSRWTIWISAWSWRRGDAAETAQNYGRVCALIFPAEALVESEIRVRRRKVRVMPDFLASKGEADLDIRLHAVPARITWSFFRLLFSFIFHQNTPAGSNVKEAGSHG